MILFSHPLIPSKKPNIKNFSSNCLNEDFVFAKDSIEAVILNANLVKFIVCDNLELAKNLQNLANDYLFDSKIAIIVKNNSELSLAIDARIDAAICDFS